MFSQPTSRVTYLHNIFLPLAKQQAVIAVSEKKKFCNHNITQALDKDQIIRPSTLTSCSKDSSKESKANENEEKMNGSRNSSIF